MTVAELKNGIAILYDMELNNYMLNRAINDLNQRISRLGIKKKIEKPTRNTIVLTDEEGRKHGSISYVKRHKFNFDDVIDSGGLLSIVAGIIGAVYGIIDTIISEEGIFDRVVGGIVMGIIYALIFAVIGFVGSCIVFFVKYFIASKKDTKSAEMDVEKALADEEVRYHNDVLLDDLRVNEELQLRNILIKERDMLKRKQLDSLQKLYGFYNKMGIDSKYRNIIPIGYMNEFARLGIATKLEGSDGLYYLVRQELRNDQFQYSLDEISRKLDKIISNQHVLYSELLGIESKCDRIISETTKSAQLAVKNNQLLDTAVQNSSVAAYNSERIARELEFQNFMLSLHV